jgi:hypothetical protein
MKRMFIRGLIDRARGQVHADAVRARGALVDPAATLGSRIPTDDRRARPARRCAGRAHRSSHIVLEDIVHRTNSVVERKRRTILARLG